MGLFPSDVFGVEFGNPTTLYGISYKIGLNPKEVLWEGPLAPCFGVTPPQIQSISP
jgi:hypothetical protein